MNENLYNPKIYEAHGCTLQAYGRNFDPNSFLRESNFIQEEILAKGTIGLPNEVRKKINQGEFPYKDVFDIFDTPFLLISLSNESELFFQVEEATLFLKDHLDDLVKLRNYPNVENVLIRFTVKQHKSDESENLPEEFSRLYSKIGIQGLLFGEF